jgi:sialic acid synthase SpsE
MPVIRSSPTWLKTLGKLTTHFKLVSQVCTGVGLMGCNIGANHPLALSTGVCRLENLDILMCKVRKARYSLLQVSSDSV